MMPASAIGALKTRSSPYSRCKPVSDFEDAPFARNLLQRFLAARVGDILAEDHDARVAGHFVLERAIDGRDHGVGFAVGPGGRLEPVCRRIDIR